MTTDPEEGRRQIEAMKPEPIKVGDKVRLAAGGERTMTVAMLADYDNTAVCMWNESGAPSLDQLRELGRDAFQREDFPVRSLVRVEPTKTEGA